MATRNKIYVLAPTAKVTGGAELLHQLVHSLNNFGQDAFIVYSGEGDRQIPQAYLGYNIKLANEIEDLQNNIVVICEGGFFDKSLTVLNAKIIFWWLSVDNFYFGSIGKLQFSDYINWNPKFAVKLFVKQILKLQNPFKSTFSVKYIQARNGIHCYQSEYAHQYLSAMGFKNLYPLSDYVNKDFLDGTASIKEDIVLYNPLKGIKYTNTLRELAPHLNWIPLINLNRVQLLDLFKRSKLYIDFGEHPGKDRFPREAALNDCCIVTGIKGSAKYFEDISISTDYKIDDSGNSQKDALKIINEILRNYESHIPNFVDYKQKILNEETQFNKEVCDLFINVIK